MHESASLGLEDRVAIVTGGSRGIGRAIACELANRGAKIVVNYHTSEKEAEEVVGWILAQGNQAIKIQADVSDFSQAQNLVANTIQIFGRLDILVNNAGTTRDNLILLMTEDDWDHIQNTNLKSTFNVSKAAVRPMMRKRCGRIINISSVSGQMGNAGQTNYSASKAGQIGFTKALAREIASRNITVNAIAAGYVDTALTAKLPEEARQGILNMIPLGRQARAEEIAYTVAFLASDQAAYITGQVIGVDGGLAMM